MSLSVRALFFGVSCGSSCASLGAALRFVVVVTVVMVVMAAGAAPSTGDVFLDAALGGALRAGGSAEGARETLRLRVVVVVSGEASAAFCERVAGIVVVGGGRWSRVVVLVGRR